jgi:hypothetical protein
MCNLQDSIRSAWQKGMRVWVFFAAMVPASGQREGRAVRLWRREVGCVGGARGWGRVCGRSHVPSVLEVGNCVP